MRVLTIKALLNPTLCLLDAHFRVCLHSPSTEQAFSNECTIADCLERERKRQHNMGFPRKDGAVIFSEGGGGGLSNELITQHVKIDE